ncbi:sensor histidine kinase [Variovorax sp. KK3]
MKTRIAMRRSIRRLAERASRNAEYFERRRRSFALVAIVGFPLYYVIWYYIFPQPYENLLLRVIGSALFVPIAFEHRWWPRLQKCRSAYWHFSVLYALPFFFSLMLFKNQSSAVWIESSLIAVFVMVLMLDWLILVFHAVAGVCLAWVAYWLSTENAHIEPVTLTHLPIILFAVILGTLANYVTEAIRLEQERAMLATAGSIAHELRTPLTSIRVGASGLHKYLPILLDAYEQAREHALSVTYIRPPHLDAIAGVLKRIETEANYSNAIIDMLINDVRPATVKPQEFVTCSIKNCIQIALARYPFSDEERDEISCIFDTDFNFKGVELLMIHVIFNLLKNSLRQIVDTGKGRIFIHTQKSSKNNQLIFKDTASGIPSEIMPHIFKRFYSSSSPDGDILGSGIGLAFCKDVVEAFGGSIRCASVPSEFSEFILTFPTIES